MLWIVVYFNQQAGALNAIWWKKLTFSVLLYFFKEKPQKGKLQQK